MLNLAGKVPETRASINRYQASKDHQVMVNKTSSSGNSANGTEAGVEASETQRPKSEALICERAVKQLYRQSLSKDLRRSDLLLSWFDLICLNVI